MSCSRYRVWLFPLLPLSVHFSARFDDALILLAAVALLLLLASAWLMRVLALALLVAVGSAWHFDLQLSLPLAYALPILIFSALALLFGSTLLPARTPMVSRFALAMGDPMTPALWRYTRVVTWGWLLLFVGLALMSLFLARAGSLHHWSLFTNAISYLLVGLMFVLEFYGRRWFVDTRDEHFFSFMKRLLVQMPTVMQGRGYEH